MIKNIEEARLEAGPGGIVGVEPSADDPKTAFACAVNGCMAARTIEEYDVLPRHGPINVAFSALHQVEARPSCYTTSIYSNNNEHGAGRG